MTKKNRHYADITLTIDGIEESDWNLLEEFLEDNNIKYTTRTENLWEESDEEDYGKPDAFDVWHDMVMTNDWQ